MRNLFEISEEEKNQIRGLHESYKSKPGTSLNEQGGRVSGVKMTDSGSIGLSRTKTKETDTITGQEGVGQEDYFDPNSEADKAEALQYYNNPKSSWNSYITDYILDRIKWWDYSSKRAFNKIMTDVPQIMFNVVAEIKRKDGDSAAIKAQRVVIEDLGETTKTTESIPKPPDIQYPGFNTDDVDKGTSDFFADNSWTPTENMKSYVQSYIIAPIVQIYEDAKNKTGETPVIFLKNLNVNSSVSRFLNSIDNQGNKIPIGENPDRMSFETLSEKRADASIQYLKEVLSPYVKWDDTIVTKNTKGENNDGSSGPDPYKEAENLINAKKFRDYKSVFDSTGFRQKYEPYKYTKFDIVVGVVPIPPKTETEEPTPGKEIKEQNFKFLFFYEETDWDFQFKLPKFSFKYTSSGKAPGFWKISENTCEIKWWQRIFKKYLVYDGF